MNFRKIIDLLANPKRFFTFLIFFNVTVLAISLLTLQPSIVRAQGTITPEIGMGLMAAAVAVAGSGIGAGIAVYGAASAGAAAMAERPTIATWIIILAGLGEGIAIYGLIIAIMILGTI